MDPSKKASEHYELNFEYKGTPVQVFEVDACQKTLYSKIKGYILNEEPSMSPGSHGGRLYFEEVIKDGRHNLPPPSECGTLYCFYIEIIYSDCPEITTTKVIFMLGNRKEIKWELAFDFEKKERSVDTILNTLFSSPGGYWNE